MIRLYYWIQDWFRLKTFGGLRSSQWPKARKEFLMKNPNCAVCNGTVKNEIHHVLPFAKFPNLELEPRNFITLCESKKKGVTCHQFFGHLGNYKDYNLDVREDAEIWHKKLL